MDLLTKTYCYTIIHLDDHTLFKRGVQLCFQEHLPNAEIINFSNNDDALSFINSSIKREKRIDLIITDFNHLGDNGYEFALQVRKLEEKHSNKIPIILLSMNNEFLQMTEDGVFDVYIHKSMECEELVSLIKNNL